MTIPVIWVLADYYTGNTNQAITLAKKIGLPFEIKKIDYNYFGILPNLILSIFPLHVKHSTIKKLKTTARVPNIIISAGRRTAVLAVYLKKILHHKIQLIHIMRPNMNPREFNLIILPQHDRYNYNLPHIIRILGSLTNIQNNCHQNRYSFNKYYSNKYKYIAVLIGGSTKNYQFTLQDAQELSEVLQKIMIHHSVSLFITFSRRTPIHVQDYFKKRFFQQDICDNLNSSDHNPYPSVLFFSEFIIVTADSISMCSEAVSTGKPTYIYMSDSFVLKKHNIFINQLLDLGIARKLDQDTQYLTHYQYKPIYELNRVIQIIEKDIL